MCLLNREKMNVYSKLLLPVLLLLPFFSIAQAPSVESKAGSRSSIGGHKGWTEPDSGLIAPSRNAKKSAAGIQFNKPGRFWYDRYGEMPKDSAFYFWDGVHEVQFFSANDTDYIQSLAAAGNDAQQLSISNDTIFLENGGYVVLPTGSAGFDSVHIYAALKDTAAALRDSLRNHWTAIMGKQASLGFTPVPNTRTITINGNTQALSANVTYTIAIPYYADSLLRAFDSLAAHNSRLISLKYGIDTGVENTRIWGYGAFYPLNANPSGYLASADATILPTANKLVMRDGAANIYANGLIPNSTTTVSSGGTTVLSTSSTYIHRLTGTQNHTFQMADATTLSENISYFFDNNSTGTLTVSDGLGGFVITLNPGGAAKVILNDNSTAAGDWDIHSYVPHTALWGTAGLNMNGWIDMAAYDIKSTGSLGSNLQRLLKGWLVDLEVTNAINGSVTGSAATLTTPRNIYGNTFNGSADVSGNIGVAYLNSGTGASSTTFWRGDGSWTAPFALTTTGSGAASFSLGTLNIPTPTLSSLGGTTDHTALSNLSWTVSGHTGTASSLAGWNGSNVAAVYSLSGTGTTIPTTTGPTFTNPVVGTQTARDSSTKAASTAYVDGAIVAERTATVSVTNKQWKPRSTTTTTVSATPSINTDNLDEYIVTAQTTNITSMTTNLTGTPYAGQIWVFEVACSSGTLTLAWGSSFENGPVAALALPTVITTTKQGIVLKWNASTSKWRCAGLY